MKIAQFGSVSDEFMKRVRLFRQQDVLYGRIMFDSVELKFNWLEQNTDVISRLKESGAQSISRAEVERLFREWMKCNSLYDFEEDVLWESADLRKKHKKYVEDGHETENDYDDIVPDLK